MKSLKKLAPYCECEEEGQVLALQMVKGIGDNYYHRPCGKKVKRAPKETTHKTIRRRTR